MEKVLVAISGGVDSSTCLILLKNRGYSPYAVTMKLIGENTNLTGVDTSSPVRDAMKAAEIIGVPFEAVDFTGDFEDRVISPFAERYAAGLTPNPCLLCNKYLKFGKLFEKADSLGIKYVATGHYARVEEKDGEFYLRKAADIKKDQSYVLCNLTRKHLERLMFPLGDLTKDEVRRIAKENSLNTAEKAESQDICFIKEGNYASFVTEYLNLPPNSGRFLDREGKVIGTHDGMIHYTVGQRRGLGMGFGERLYVLSKNPIDNTVTLGYDGDLFADELILRDVNIISGEFPSSPFRAAVKIRYHHKEQPATVTPLGEGRLKVVFGTPQRAITPGQWGVIYDGDYVIGGGVIC